MSALSTKSHNGAFLWALLVLILSLLTIPTFSAVIEKPDKKTLQEDIGRLNDLIQVFLDTQKRGEQFGKEYWKASGKLAAETGPRIVYAVMVRCHVWHGEEPLIFVPLLALLDRNETISILQHYKHSPLEIDRVNARELMIELDSEDVKEGASYFKKTK